MEKPENIKETQRKVWNNIAKLWGEYRQKIPPEVKNFVKKTNGKLLDLGCGTGRNFWRVRGQELYGIDFSKEMIKLSKENAKNKRIDAKFSVMEAEILKFKDNFFEGILCWAVLHCIESKERRMKVLKEIYRVLKPGGETLISSWGSNSPRLKNKEKECFIPWSVKDNTKEMRYTYIYDMNEFLDDLSEAGFKIERSWEDRNVNAIVSKGF